MKKHVEPAMKPLLRKSASRFQPSEEAKALRVHQPEKKHYCKLHLKRGIKVEMHKKGWAWSGGHMWQKFTCPKCGFSTTAIPH